MPLRQLLLAGACLLAGPATSCATEDSWWLTPQRMLQTNLREIDVAMDIPTYVAAVKDSGASVVLLNVGGIVANYPTELPFQHRNPRLQNDFVGEVIDGLHAAKIRVVARFDFSKANAALVARHPEWAQRYADGRPFPAYNEQVPVCLHSWYQQEGRYQILAEVVARYPIDGVFFNSPGFLRSDYSGQYLGRCYCEGCRDAFRAQHGAELPADDSADPALRRAYDEFTAAAARAMVAKVANFMRENAPRVMVLTSVAGNVIRRESGHPLRNWAYQEAYNERLFFADNAGRQLTNSAVNFPDFPHRHSSVGPTLTRQRMFNAMVGGGWLDFYCIGPFHQQEDHRDHERWLLPAKPVSDVGIVIDQARGSEELRGLVNILTHAHLAYDFTKLETADLARFPALLMPVLEPLTAEATAQLDAYVQAGGRLLLTGGPVPPALACLGLAQDPTPLPATQGTYFQIRPEDKTRLDRPLFAEMDLLMFTGAAWAVEPPSDGENLLRYIPPAMFGPPEKCYYTEISAHPGLIARGQAAWIPWSIGAEFQKHADPAHAAVLLGAFDSLLALPRRVELDGPAIVELHHRADAEGRFEWISLYNHGGGIDQFLDAPLPVRDLTLTLRPAATVTSARLLRAGAALDFTAQADGSIVARLPELDAFEIILFEY